MCACLISADILHSWSLLHAFDTFPHRMLKKMCFVNNGWLDIGVCWTWMCISSRAYRSTVRGMQCTNVSYCFVFCLVFFFLLSFDMMGRLSHTAML